MKLSVEILDHIFSFLGLNNLETLRACSEDPVLSPIVERHLFYSLIVSINHRWVDPYYTFKPDMLSKLVSDNPRILYHVRLLRIDIQREADGPFEEFAKTLVKFPVLEYIVLTASNSQDSATWPDVFRAALEDRLNLPTIKGVHLIGKHFPLSLFDKCKNMKKLCLLASHGGEGQDLFEIQPKLRSLTMCTGNISPPFLAWIKLNIKELQSLKCGLALSEGQKLLSEFLGVCSESLKELDINLAETSYESAYFPDEAEPIIPVVEFFPLPRNLQQLTIRATVSLFPLVAETISLFISSIEHLVLDIDVSLRAHILTDVDFSPLAILGAASLSIPHIDLYVHTDSQPSALTHAQILPSLDKYEDIAKSIKDGVLVVHSEQTAPDCA